MENIKQERIPNGYKMISFGAESLFTNVPLKKTIDITLERIYDCKEINTQITRFEMKELLTLCTKNVHLAFHNQVHQQNNGAERGPHYDQFMLVSSWLNWKLGLFQHYEI